MRKLFSILIVALLITGCTNQRSAHEVDLRNSPCACHYEGQQLITEPTQEMLKEVADLQFS